MQKHAHKQEYAITIKHLEKKQKKNKHIIKVILICDWGQKQYINYTTTHLNTTLQSIEYLFACYAVNKKYTGNWILIVTNSNYNHLESSHPFAYAIHYIANCNSF